MARNSQTRITSRRWMLPVWPTMQLDPFLISPVPALIKDHSRTTLSKDPLPRNQGNNHPHLLSGIFAVTSPPLRCTKPVHRALEEEYFCIIFIQICPLPMFPLFAHHWFLHRLKTSRILHIHEQGSTPKVKIPESFYGFLF